MQSLKCFCLPVLFFSFLSITSLAQPGTLDTSFGNGGIVTTDFRNNYDYGQRIVIQNDGKILMAGYSTDPSSADPLYKNHISVCRYLADGKLDASFGHDKKIYLTFPYSAAARDIALQSDNKIIIAANSNKTLLLIRLKKDGFTDSSFGENGIVKYATTGHEDVFSIKIQKDGKIVTAGDAKSPLYPRINDC